MVFVYGFFNGNTFQARTEYQTRFPQRRAPNCATISNAFRRLRETGSVQPRRGGRGNNVAVDTQEEILSSVRIVISDIYEKN